MADPLLALVRPELAALEPYKVGPAHGDDVGIKLDANELAYALPPEIADDLSRYLSVVDLNRYPDGRYRELREAAAAYVGHGVGWEQVVVGAGADDLILLCARTYLGPGRRSAITPPTYVLYRLAT